MKHISDVELELHRTWLNKLKEAAKEMPSSVGFVVLQTLLAAAIVASKANTEHVLEGVRRIVGVLSKERVS